MKTEKTIERVKSVEDAQTLTGMRLPENIQELPVDVQAFMKLRIVAAALNGLTAKNLSDFPKFTPGEHRYYPWFWLISQQEYENMTTEEKGRCVGRSLYSADSYGGLVYAVANNASSYSFTSYAVRLAFRTRELAEYAGKQFKELWADLYFLPE